MIICTFCRSPDAIPTDQQRLQDAYGHKYYPAGSNVDRLLQNAIVFDILDPFRLQPQQATGSVDPFLQAWQSQNATLVQRINAAHPLRNTSEAYYQAPLDYFSSHTPHHYSSFVYDAVMLLGIAACQLQMQNASLVIRETMIPHMHNMTQFTSASGKIAPFSSGRAYRNPTTDFKVGLFNIRPTLTEQGNRTYNAVLVQIWSHDTWTNVPNQQLLYRDGTTNPPIVLKNVQHNYLSSSVRAIGFTVLGVTWCIALGGIVAIYALRWTNTMRRAQPFFLILLCIGSLITSLAIFTLSWDENTGATQQQLDLACTSTPWLFFIGHVVTTMALFSALWRLDRVLQFRRRNIVSVRQVLGPLLGLLSVTLLILILWTALDPWTWHRRYISDVPPVETYGECSCNHFWAFFGPLMAIIVVAESLAAVFAWRTSDVPGDLADSRTVLWAICGHVQSWVIGMPILGVLRDESANATYLARVLVICTFSISSVLVVVGPRVYTALFVEGTEGRQRSYRFRGSSSLGPQSGTENNVSSGRGRVFISGVKPPSQRHNNRNKSDEDDTSSVLSPPQPQDSRRGNTSSISRKDNTSSLCSSVIPEVEDLEASDLTKDTHPVVDEYTSRDLTREEVAAATITANDATASGDPPKVDEYEYDDDDEFATA